MRLLLSHLTCEHAKLLAAGLLESPGFLCSVFGRRLGQLAEGKACRDLGELVQKLHSRTNNYIPVTFIYRSVTFRWWVTLPRFGVRP